MCLCDSLIELQAPQEQGQGCPFRSYQRAGHTEVVEWILADDNSTPWG